MTIEQRYRRDSRDAIVPRVLDDIVLLYHRPSGQTHMVISPVPEMLEALDDGLPASARELYERLARRYDMGPVEPAVADLTAHLRNMAALGLIRAA